MLIIYFILRSARTRNPFYQSLESLLSLCFRNFFDKDPGYWIPSCVAISVPISVAIADPESHAHRSFGYVITVSLDMADTENIIRASLFQVHNPVNS